MSHALAMPWAIPVIFGCTVGIVAILAGATSSTIKALAETSLKKRMVNQGFSVSDIERVICATANRCPHCGVDYPNDEHTPSKPMKPPKRHAGVV